MRAGGYEDKGKGTAASDEAASSSSRGADSAEGWTIRDVFGDADGDLMGLTGLGPVASAVNFMQSVRIAAGDMIDVEQTVQFNRRFSVPNPALQSPTGHYLWERSSNDGASDLRENSLFGAVNNSLILELMNNSYAFPYISHDNACFSSAVRPLLKRKADDFGSSLNFENFPPHRGSLYPPITSSFSDDSAIQSSSFPEAAFDQRPSYPAIERQSYMDCDAAQTPKSEMIKSEDMNIFSLPHDLRLGGSSGTPFPASKRKAANHKHMNRSKVLDGSQNNSELFSIHLRGQNSFGLASVLDQSLSWSVHCAEHHNLEYLGRFKDDKELKGGCVMILQKELRNSDVGSLGRIVLPKRDAEANLPALHEPKGVILRMEDMISSVLWEFKFRYWPNNKSRMYVMENTGGFVKEHKLQTGDLFVIYKEECSGKYIVGGRKGCTSSFSLNHVEQNCTDPGNIAEVCSTGLPRCNRVIEISHQPYLEPSTSVPTANFLMPNAEVNNTSTGRSYYVDGQSGGSTPSTQPLWDF